jgi:small subunit ribosomal protein S17
MLKINKERIGIIVRTGSDKTGTLKVENRYRHPIYRKIITHSKNYLVHDPLNKINIGDLVLVEEITRPISKKKRWRVKKIYK